LHSLLTAIFEVGYGRAGLFVELVRAVGQVSAQFSSGLWRKKNAADKTSTPPSSSPSKNLVLEFDIFSAPVHLYCLDSDFCSLC